MRPLGRLMWDSTVHWTVEHRFESPRAESKTGLARCQTRMFTVADHSQLIANTWLVYAIRGGFALVVPFGLSS